MKNYKLFKLRFLKTGLVFGVNKFGQRWIELWYRGKFIMIDAQQFKRACAEEWEFLKTGQNPLKQDPTPIQVYLYKGETMGKECV